MKFFTTICDTKTNSSCVDIRNLWIVVILLSIVMGIGVVGVPIMDNDAGHHAVIALNMTESGNYVDLIDVTYLRPYFDKPHLQFWMVGASFALFGVGSFVYKLSSLFFILLSFVSTFKLAQRVSTNKNLPLYSIVVLGSMTAFMLNSSVDIRMDAMLSGAVIFAIWQGVVCIGGSVNPAKKDEKFRIMPYLGLALGLAMAMATKGLYGFVITGIAMLCYMIAVNRIKWLFSWRFVLALGLFGIMILPLLWAYYEQFGWEGVRFILYEQVLLRTNGGMGTSGAEDPFFFLHTLIWVVLPWSVIMYWFIVRTIVKKSYDIVFWLTVISSAAVVTMLSFSSFKLPQYLNPIFPLVALFVANELLKIKVTSKAFKALVFIQKINILCIVIGSVAVNYWSFAFQNVLLAVVFGLALCGVLCTIFLKWDSIYKVVLYSSLSSVILWLGLNSNAYPQLLKYQAGNELAEICKQKGFSPSDIAVYRWNDYSSSFDIEHGGLHKVLFREDLFDSTGAIEQRFLMIDSVCLDSVKNDPRVNTQNWKAVEKLNDYRITQLDVTFLNPKTRSQVLSKSYLIDMKGL